MDTIIVKHGPERVVKKKTKVQHVIMNHGRYDVKEEALLIDKAGIQRVVDSWNNFSDRKITVGDIMKTANEKIARELVKIAKSLIGSDVSEEQFEKFANDLERRIGRVMKLKHDPFARVGKYDIMYQGKKIGSLVHYVENVIRVVAGREELDNPSIEEAAKMLFEAIKE